MKTKIRRQLAHRKRRLLHRLDPSDLRGCDQPMFTARNIHYEIGQRTRGLAYGGIGAMHLLAGKLGLIEGKPEGTPTTNGAAPDISARKGRTPIVFMFRYSR